MSLKSLQSKNKGTSIITTTFDCCCGLKIDKTCPRAVALQKRLHLSKNESCRLQYEAQKAREDVPLHKFTESKWNSSGKSVQNVTMITQQDFAFGGKCIK